MKEELISFETAKLAKEKRFNNYDFLLYDRDGNLIHPMLYNTNDFIPAPTQALLQKWLREVHNIHCWVIKPFDTYLGVVNGKIVTECNTVATYTFEEALEKGLYAALKLIEI